MNTYWTNEEIDILIKNYPINGVAGCTSFLDRNKNAIRVKANKLGLNILNVWGTDEILFLKENYSNFGSKYCGEKLRRDAKDIKEKAYKLKIPRITTESYINELSKIHNGFYNYSKVIYVNSTTKIIITCPIHGDFTQIPHHHKKGRGCPMCSESNGEKTIRDYLNKHNINFIPQHKFDDCKRINLLPFDFYIPEYNTCIEYQGEQHYRPCKLFGENAFKLTTESDEIKRKYCNKNNITLVEIKYNENIVKKLDLIY
jgi:hypothetical protein